MGRGPVSIIFRPFEPFSIGRDGPRLRKGTELIGVATNRLSLWCGSHKQRATINNPPIMDRAHYGLIAATKETAMSQGNTKCSQHDSICAKMIALDSGVRIER